MRRLFGSGSGSGGGGGGPPLSNAAPLDLGTADPGTSGDASRADHVHAHGLQGGGTLHSLVSSRDPGFMSSAMLAKLNAATAGPTFAFGADTLLLTGLAQPQWMRLGSAPQTADATPVFNDIGCRVAVAGVLTGMAASHFGSVANAVNSVVTYSLWINGVAVPGASIPLAADAGLPAVEFHKAINVPIAAGDLVQIRVDNDFLAVSTGNMQVTVN